MFFLEYLDDSQCYFHVGNRNSVKGFSLRSHILKQTCTWKLQVCLSICDLFVPSKVFRQWLAYNFCWNVFPYKDEILLPLIFLLYLNRGSYPSIWNYAFGKEQLSFVTNTMSMSVLFFVILDKISDLFLKDLIFMCPIIILSILDRQILSKRINRLTENFLFLPKYS